ncbi:MAG: nuclear transport factor 2 family protein, partial [Bacteroidota bacterium]
MKQGILIALALVLCTINVMAQNMSLEKEVKAVLHQFIKAGDENNVEPLEHCLNGNFRTALYDAKKDEVTILDRDTYISFIKNKKFGGYPRTIEFHSIEFIGNNMASAKATLSSPGKPTLKNFYSLAKEKGEWKILQDFVIL